MGYMSLDLYKKIIDELHGNVENHLINSIDNLNINLLNGNLFVVKTCYEYKY